MKGNVPCTGDLFPVSVSLILGGSVRFVTSSSKNCIKSVWLCIGDINSQWQVTFHRRHKVRAVIMHHVYKSADNAL